MVGRFNCLCDFLKAFEMLIDFWRKNRPDNCPKTARQSNMSKPPEKPDSANEPDKLYSKLVSNCPRFHLSSFLNCRGGCGGPGGLSGREGGSGQGKPLLPVLKKPPPYPPRATPEPSKPPPGQLEMGGNWKRAYCMGNAWKAFFLRESSKPL